jgi:hypothetical protein
VDEEEGVIDEGESLLQVVGGAGRLRKPIERPPSVRRGLTSLEPSLPIFYSTPLIFLQLSGNHQPPFPALPPPSDQACGQLLKFSLPSVFAHCPWHRLYPVTSQANTTAGYISAPKLLDLPLHRATITVPL